MKKIILSIITSICIFGATSCSDMLDVENSRFVENPSLDSKTDSVFYAYGIMQAMQQLADQYFFQNEMRGELVEPTALASTHLQSLSNFTAGTDCKYDSVYLYYKVINNCNYYLANRDTTLMTSNANVVKNEYCAVAAFRAWAYLQMTHQYGNVPYVTEPVLSISQINSIVETQDYRTILQSQADYLQKLKNSVSEDQLEVPDYMNGAAINIGRTQWGFIMNVYPKALFIPLNVVLGDIYLELGEYQKAALAYFDYLRYKAKTNGNIDIAYLEARMNPIDPEFRYPDDWDSQLNKNFFNNAIYANLINEFVSRKNGCIISSVVPAVDFSKGHISQVPQAFGYDYYSSEEKQICAYSYNNVLDCPETENVQVQPSAIYNEMTYNAPFYYYTGTQKVIPYEKLLSQANLGDARANNVLPGKGSYSDRIYVGKPSFGSIFLYRNVTIYLRLAEAFNRMGYPEIAFAILKTGLSTKMKAYLETAYKEDGGIDRNVYYIPEEAYQMLVDVVPFLSDDNKDLFPTTFVIGIHSRGAGVTDELNSPYRYNPIVEERIEKIRKDFNIGLNDQSYTKEEYINAVEDLLCDEYALELAFEGTRFSDLLRIARHKNSSSPYGNAFGDRWLSKKLESKAPGITTENCYLPFK